MNPTKYGAYIGRFQIPTKAHLLNIESAFNHVQHLFVVIGTAYGPFDDANPFSGAERREMLVNALVQRGHVNLANITFLMMDDYPDDNDWAAEVRRLIDSQALYGDVTLIGMNKDSSSFYLKMFPEWKSVALPPITYNQIRIIQDADYGDCLVSATDIRREWINHHGELSEESLDVIDPSTDQYLSAISLDRDRMKLLKEEQDFYYKHRDMWSDAPFPVQFITADAALICNGKIALIRRKDAPGKGLWALPGGYVNPNETIHQAVMREATEETGADFSDAGFGFSQHHFYRSTFQVDSPRRSRRGRILTHVGIFTYHHFPNLTAGDDADDVTWVHNSRIGEWKHKMFEDHFYLATRAFKETGHVA